MPVRFRRPISEISTAQVSIRMSSPPVAPGRTSLTAKSSELGDSEGASSRIDIVCGETVEEIANICLTMLKNPVDDGMGNDREGVKAVGRSILYEGLKFC